MDAKSLELARQKRIDEAWAEICLRCSQLENLKKAKVSEPVSEIKEKNGIKFIVHKKEIDFE